MRGRLAPGAAAVVCGPHPQKQQAAPCPHPHPHPPPTPVKGSKRTGRLPGRMPPPARPAPTGSQPAGQGPRPVAAPPSGSTVKHGSGGGQRCIQAPLPAGSPPRLDPLPGGRAEEAPRAAAPGRPGGARGGGEGGAPPARRQLPGPVRVPPHPPAPGGPTCRAAALTSSSDSSMDSSSPGR